MPIYQTTFLAGAEAIWSEININSQWRDRGFCRSREATMG